MDGTFGARLYDAQTLWIEAQGGGDWRDATFALAIGSTVASLSPWWNYGNAPHAHDVILRIAKVTGVDPGWLAYGDESQAPKPEIATPDKEAVKGPLLNKPAKVLKKEPTHPVRSSGNARGQKHG